MAAATKVDKLKEARKAALLQRMKQGQAVSSGIRSYFKEGLEGVGFWAPKEGDHILDIIPYMAGPDDPNVKEGNPTYVLEIYIHPDVGGIENQTMICMEKTYKKPCPICEHRRSLQKEGADEDLVKSLQPRRYPRSIYNVVCYDSEKDESKGIQIFDTSHYLFEMYLLKLAQGSSRGGQRPTGFIPFADPEEGKSIRFTRQGMKENTRYIAHAFENRNYVISPELLETAHQLDQLIHIPTYEEVYQAYWGETSESEALPKTVTSSEPPAPARPAGRVRPTQQVATPPAEEEEESPPPVEAEEEAPPEGENQDDFAAALVEMDRAALKAFIAEQGLDIKVYKEQPDGKYSDEWIREQIVVALEGATEAPATPATPTKAPAVAGKKAGGAVACPGGGTFGKDLNDLQHCEACTVWDDCMAENEKMLKQQQASKDKGKATVAPGKSGRSFGARK